MKSILGIGNALVDTLISIESDEFLLRHHLLKGGMSLVDDHRIRQLLRGHREIPVKSVGGSAANTIHALGILGNRVSFIGKVGSDDWGDFFESDLKTRGITTHLSRGKLPTGKALVLISRDSERTFATFLGSCGEQCAGDLREEFFIGPDLLYLEGYLIPNRELVQKAAWMARKQQMTIALDLSSYNVVEENREFLRSFIDENVDILLANEDETRAFFGVFDPLENLSGFARYCRIAILKMGAEGAYLQSGKEVHKIDPVKSRRRDTTGAGDLFAAGFLHGWSRGYDLSRCGKLGALLGGRVIEVVGAKMDDRRWKRVKKNLSTIR